jgi:hypothetical protein
VRVKILRVYLVLLLVLLCLLLARAACAQDLTTAEPYNPGPRFILSLWYPVDLQARRLSNTTDAGTLIRLWSFRSPSVEGAEDVIGPVLGVRTLGLGWVWRLRDSSLMAGVAVVVNTEGLFDRQRPLKAMPAVTLSYRLPEQASAPTTAPHP